MINKAKSRGLKTSLALATSALLLSGTAAIADVLNPVIGPILFEEQFNTFDATKWNTIEGDGCGIGLCGWGNAELEYYRAPNLTIESPPFEPSTKALTFTAKREAFGGRNFTSGKIDSANKIQVKYGLVEFRMAVPQVGIGLWPAGWMLGTSLASWPSKGELDIMEMGHKAATMADAGYGGGDVNAYVGSNAIYYATAACVPGNESCAASTAWKTPSSYLASTSLANRFVTYRMYWTDTQIRYTIIDNGVEHDMYKAPIPITAESSEFNAPFYFLFNLAVGGNFTDAASDAQVTAPLPGKMYIDYIRVYQLDGKGEVKLGSQVPKETGTYGIFTDNTPTSAKETIGTTADFWIWNTTSMQPGTLPAYEGSNVLALKYTAPNQWFGGGIASRQAHDMSNFANGSLKFRIKIPANVSFKIAINDTYTNSASVTFPANTTTYGLVRNGDWGQATIPIADIRGINALQSMSQLFSFTSVDGQLPQAAFDMAIDDIVWDCGSGAQCQSVPVSSASSSPSSIASSSSSSVKSSAPSTSSSKSSTATSSASSVKSSSTSSISSTGVTLVSTGRPVTASTQLQAAANAVDGNSGTRWESTQGVSPSWIAVDLGSAKALTQVVIDWEAANAADYQIQGSNDNATWTTLKMVTGGAFGNRTDTNAVAGTYRYVRIYCTARSAGNNWGYSIWELKVYGSNAPASQLTIATALASTQIQAATNAIDKNSGTRWESALNIDPSWLTLDLGSSRALANLSMDWEAANAANYLVQGSNDNATWTTLSTQTGGTFGNRTDNIPVSGNYRYVRIYGTARSTGNQWGYSIWEARVTGY